MGTISEKLTYLNTTKGKLKDVINMTNAGIDNQTTFRNYAQALYDGYINVLKDRDTLLDNMNIGTSSGSISDSADLPIYEDKMSKLSTQETTTGKNKANNLAFTNVYSNVNASYNTLTTIDTGVEYKTTFSSGAPIVVIPTGVDLSNYVGKVVRMKCNYTAGGQYRLYLSNSDNSAREMKSYSTSSNQTISFTVPNDLGDNKYLSYGFMISVSTSSQVDFTDLIITIDNDDMTYEKFTYGASPNPDYPQEVKTVKGYRNLFDENNMFIGYYDLSNYSLVSNDKYRTVVIDNLPVGTYTFNTTLSNCYLLRYYANNTNTYISTAKNNYTFTITTQSRFMLSFRNTSTSTITENFNTIVVEGNTVLPYVPYGTNWINTTISDGTNSKNITIPLNDNEICGIGTYKDELIVDKNGHCWLNKKTGKVVLNGTENWKEFTSSPEGCYRVFSTDVKIGITSNFENDLLSNYFQHNAYIEKNNIIKTKFATYINIDNTIANTINQFTSWLSNHSTKVYYPLAESNLIDLNYNVDLTLYEGINNITNSEDMDMAIKYIKDTYE